MIFLECLFSLSGLLVFCFLVYFTITSWENFFETIIGSLFWIAGAVICLLILISDASDLVFPSHKQEATVEVVDLYSKKELKNVITKYYVVTENKKEYRVSSSQLKELKKNHMYKISYYKNNKLIYDFEEFMEKKEKDD